MARLIYMAAMSLAFGTWCLHDTGGTDDGAPTPPTYQDQAQGCWDDWCIV